MSDVRDKFNEKGLTLTINNEDEDDQLSESDLEDYSNEKDSKVEKHSTPGNQQDGKQS